MRGSTCSQHMLRLEISQLLSAADHTGRRSAARARPEAARAAWNQRVPWTRDGDGAQDPQRAAGGNRGLQAVEEADVLAAEVDVDEAAQVAACVEAFAQLAMRAKERLQRVADGGP